MIDKVTMYKRSNSGGIVQWSIWQSEHDLIEMEYGAVGGEMTQSNEVVNFGLASRTKQEQIKSRINSRLNKKIDSGYVCDISEVREKATNLIGKPKPMLAYRFDKFKGSIPPDSYVQYKYDGNRCMITNDCGKITAYSRNGKLISSIDHILNDIRIPAGVTVDGELYCHGESLQTIVSWIKRKQDGTKSIKYIMYDIVDSSCYKKRLMMIRSIYENSGKNISLAVTIPLGNEDISTMLSCAIEIGYEGLIIRIPGFPYEDGKRSKSLIKVKAWRDDEFKVIKISKSKDGWAILHLQSLGKSFTVTSPGTHQEKEECYTNRDLYIYRMVKIAYANLTKDGIPFHPVALCWRNKSEE